MVQDNKVGLSAEHVTLQEQTLTDEQQQADGLTVTGLALPFGEESRNGVMYEESSVREAAETMIGTAVLFNHDQDEVVGHVEDVEVHDEGLSYRMNLNPDHELVESVERGDISNVSIQALVDPMEGDTNKVEVKEFLELSLVTIPGFKQTNVEVEEVGDVPEGVMTVENFVQEAEDKAAEPFAGYDDFEDCVNQNQDKDDPEGYCGEIKDRAEQFTEEQYDSYPEQAVENAQTALDADENTEFDNEECGTQVGWERANQLVNGENLSEDTVRRMHSFFERSEGNEEVEEPPKEEDCGWLMHMAWGGDAAKEWAAEMVAEFDGEESNGTEESVSKSEKNNILGELSMEKIKEQLSADEVDSLMELINIHNEAMKEDIREYMEENDLIEDDSEEPEDDEEPEDEEEYDDKDKDMDDDEEESAEESVEDESDEEDKSEESVDEDEDVEEESVDEEEESDEEKSEESVEDEPVDPVAEEMDEASEGVDFKATIPSISR